MMASVPSLLAMAALVVRVSLVVVLGMAVAFVCRRSGAALRHQVWLGTLAGTLITGVAGTVAFGAGWGPVFEAFRVAHAPLAGGVGHRIAVACLAVWTVGSIIAGARVCRAIAAARRLTARARELGDPAWQSILSEAIRSIQPGAWVELRESPELVLPVTWGIRKPAVLLPPGAAAWPEARRRAVLLHELAHVRRRDCAIELLIGLAGTLYWFHPGVWYVVRRLRLAREQACDRMVLEAGTPLPGYAADLVALLRSATEARRSAVAVPGIGGGSPLEDRILALARPDEPRLRQPARVAIAFAPLTAALLLAVWSPISAVDQGSTAAAPGHSVAKGKCACAVRFRAPARH